MPKRKVEDAFAHTEGDRSVDSDSESSSSTDRSNPDGYRRDRDNHSIDNRQHRIATSCGNNTSSGNMNTSAPASIGGGNGTFGTGFDSMQYEVDSITGLPRQRQAANARERDRTHSVNSAFVHLRELIPTEPRDRKLSKIETLRLATSYINHLGTLLLVGDEEIEQPCMHRAMLRPGSEAGPRIICTFCLQNHMSNMRNRATMNVHHQHMRPMDMDAMMAHRHPAHMMR